MCSQVEPTACGSRESAEGLTFVATEIIWRTGFTSRRWSTPNNVAPMEASLSGTVFLTYHLWVTLATGPGAMFRKPLEEPIK